MDRVPIPAWKHLPHLGYLQYRNGVTHRALDVKNIKYLPPLNPYLGFINHSVPPVKEPPAEKKDASTQTEPVPEFELGKQLMDKMGYK
jgi:hypothetical protein